MVTSLGRNALQFLEYLGEVAFLAYETVVSVISAPIRWSLVMRQIMEVGWRSQLMVLVTGLFTGAVLTAQTYFQFSKLGMKSAVGSVVAVAMFRELGPTLGGLMVGGRVGASIAAEIGTMKVTEQIDGLRSLGVHPVDFLVVPRVLALLISMPILILESVGLSLIASYLVAVNVLDVSGPYHLQNVLTYVGLRDVKMCVTKAMVFAVIIVLVSCHQGLSTKEGAVGVGRAPTEAVVIASLTIIMVNFVMTFALNMIFPAGV